MNTIVLTSAALLLWVTNGSAQTPPSDAPKRPAPAEASDAPKGKRGSALITADTPPARGPVFDAVLDAQTPRTVESKRPESQKTAHDQSDVFAAPNAPHSSEALQQQPDRGEV